MDRTVALSRRTLLLGAQWLTATPAGEPVIRFGILTDVHHADKSERGTRYYRESLSKLAEITARFRESKPAFVIQLGDLVDAATDLDTEQQWLREAVRALKTCGSDVYSVLGNHCIQTLTKAQFLKEVGRETGHYFFDRAGLRFIVLDACHRKDGVSYDAGNFDWKDSDIPPDQHKWLERQLAATPARAVVFVHQRLDIEGVHSVATAPAIRRLLEKSGKVLAVFQGHSHQNDYREINGIHYCTMRAVIEGTGFDNNGYGLVNVYADGRLMVQGFRAQRSYQPS